MAENGLLSFAGGSGSLFIKDFVTGAPEPTEKNYSESCSTVIDLNEFIPICRVGNFHRSLSDMILCTELGPVMGSSCKFVEAS